MPDIAFTLEDQPGVDAVWVCGYERGASALIRELRRRYPSALIVVTSREPAESWEGEVLAAHADHATVWPVEYERLSRLLHRAVVERRA